MTNSNHWIWKKDHNTQENLVRLPGNWFHFAFSFWTLSSFPQSSVLKWSRSQLSAEIDGSFSAFSFVAFPKYLNSKPYILWYNNTKGYRQRNGLLCAFRDRRDTVCVFITELTVLSTRLLIRQSSYTINLFVVCSVINNCAVKYKKL